MKANNFDTIYKQQMQAHRQWENSVNIEHVEGGGYRATEYPAPLGVWPTLGVFFLPLAWVAAIVLFIVSIAHWHL